MADAADHCPDTAREARIGLSEAVFCASKTPGQIAAVAARLDGAGPTLFTRLSPERHAGLPGPLRAALDYDPESGTAYLGDVPAAPAGARVALVTAGTSDVPVAREAARTLRFHGVGAREFHDIGVAGLWRLLDRVEDIRSLEVTVVFAGMEGALASVVAGLVSGPVIAVPTSVGYGVARDGRVALGAALGSCAPGLVAVNVDNGYGAACAALRALRVGVPGSGGPEG